MTEHPVNVRDLGGLRLVGGGVTPHGWLLRGDAPYAGDAPPPGVPWPPTLVIDLRSERERTCSPYEWDSRTTVHAVQLFDPGALDHLTDSGGLLDVYRTMLAAAGPVVADLVDLIGRPDASGPTLVHCTAGKDRTGVVIAAVLLQLGVDEADVVADYRRTEDAIDAVVTRAAERGLLDPSTIDPANLAAPREAIDLVISWIREGGLSA